MSTNPELVSDNSILPVISDSSADQENLIQPENILFQFPIAIRIQDFF